MTRAAIELNFANAIIQANKLESCADNMRKVSSGDIRSARNQLQCAWDGNEADLFVNKMDLTAENILKIAARLDQVAQTLRSVAKTYRDAELKALEIATQRTVVIV